MTFFKRIAITAMLLTPFMATPALAIQFGNDSSEWANDGECDDPRFGGPGMASVLLDEDIGRDANDCRYLLNRGDIYVLSGGGKSTGNPFGNNSSEWAYDGECDDPRFYGNGMASVLLDEDIGRDAEDCRTLYNRGAINWR